MNSERQNVSNIIIFSLFRLAGKEKKQLKSINLLRIPFQPLCHTGQSSLWFRQKQHHRLFLTITSDIVKNLEKHTGSKRWKVSPAVLKAEKPLQICPFLQIDQEDRLLEDVEHLSQLCSTPFGFISVFKSRNNYCGQESGKAETQEQKPERESSPLRYQKQQKVPSFVGFIPLASRDLCGDAIWCFLMSRFWMSVSVFFSRSPLPTVRRPLPPLRSVIHRTLSPHFVKESLLESMSV